MKTALILLALSATAWLTLLLAFTTYEHLEKGEIVGYFAGGIALMGVGYMLSQMISKEVKIVDKILKDLIQ